MSDNRPTNAGSIPKGAHGGECNRTACDNRPAYSWNKSTHTFYCVHCARRINEACGEIVCILDGGPIA